MSVTRLGVVPCTVLTTIQYLPGASVRAGAKSKAIHLSDCVTVLIGSLAEPTRSPGTPLSSLLISMTTVLFGCILDCSVLRYASARGRLIWFPTSTASAIHCL